MTAGSMLWPGKSAMVPTRHSMLPHWCTWPDRTHRMPPDASRCGAKSTWWTVPPDSTRYTQVEFQPLRCQELPLPPAAEIASRVVSSISGPGRRQRESDPTNRLLSHIYHLLTRLTVTTDAIREQARASESQT